MRCEPQTYFKKKSSQQIETIIPPMPPYSQMGILTKDCKDYTHYHIHNSIFEMRLTNEHNYYTKIHDNYYTYYSI